MTIQCIHESDLKRSCEGIMSTALQPWRSERVLNCEGVWQGISLVPAALCN